ncbi:MAG: cyanophycin synthetase, partial [Myxococcales bacterium]
MTSDDPSSNSQQPPLAPKTVRALRGPNVWTRDTAIEALIELQERHARLTPELERALCERFPALAAVDLGPTLAHALGRISLALQAHAGCAVAFSRTTAIGPLTFKVVVEYTEEEVGRRALALGQALVEAALDDRPFDTAAALAELRSLDERERLGPSTASIARAAERRGIPVRRLTDGNLLQLGWGCRQRRVWTAETDRTPAIAELAAKDKELTKTLLRSVGVPVPEGRVAGDAEDAWRAAQEIGLPVVVKPLDGNHGRGVAVGLTTREQVISAFGTARREGESVLVERFAPGCDHRLLVIGGKLVAAARREPPKVTSDGVRTLAELIEAENRDPRRGEDHATSLNKIPVDDIARAVLAEQGYALESVPAAGQVVVLRRNGNLSTGGSSEDVTDRVHPSIAAHAVEAARAVGLDIAGIDVVCADVSVPLEEQGGLVVEVNAGPGFRMHLSPSSGKPRPVGEAVIDSVFPEGDNGRIPVVAISGNNGKTTTTRLIAHIFEAMGKRVGMTCTDGLYIDRRRIDDGDCSGPKSARTVLFHPLVEVAVLETARGGLLREGLGFDRCDVGVVTNVGRGDHLGQYGITTVEQLAEVKRTGVANVAPTGTAVLNAAD